MPILSNEKYSLYYQRISLAYKSPEIKASLEVILSVFTVMILIFAAIRPTLTNIASLQKKIDDQGILTKKADNKIAELFKLQAQLDQYQSKLPLYDAAIPDKYSYFGMAGRIEYLANKYRLNLDSLAMPGLRVSGSGKAAGDWAAKLLTKDSSNILATGITFAVSGNPQSVVGMISEIENMDRLTMMKNIVFTKDPGKTVGLGTLKASVQIYFYFYQKGT